VAAWRAPVPGGALRPRLWGTTVLPAAVTVMATCLLARDHWAHSSGATVVLAAAAMLVVAVRGVLSVRELRQLLLSRREALTDDLTGLANRRALLRALEAACHPGAPAAALLLCDLDGFKEFNDTLGHQAGDDLLREAAARIARAMDPDGLVARLGGDEFAVLLGGHQTIDDCERIAHKLKRAFDAPFDLPGGSRHVGLSIGAALIDGAGAFEEALHEADIAMYTNKRAHSTRFTRHQSSSSSPSNAQRTR
jgi:diguanylate cyclase (GGDEF)-like protein